MVCSTCTLLHPQGALNCYRCGRPLSTKLQRVTCTVSEHAPTSVGIACGVSLLTCLTLALLFPFMATQTLAIGAYFGIISITNIWLSVYRDSPSDDRLQGSRGTLYGLAVLASLVGELARLQGLNSIPLPTLDGSSLAIPVPSALNMELLAAVLLIIDPLLVRPLVRWVEQGVERGEPVEQTDPEA
jgi:hypothetical protein